VNETWVNLDVEEWGICSMESEKVFIFFVGCPPFDGSSEMLLICLFVCFGMMNVEWFIWWNSYEWHTLLAVLRWMEKYGWKRCIVLNFISSKR